MNDTVEQLKARLLTDPDRLAQAVAEGLAAAGGTSEWDSETIEYVLEPIQAYAVSVGVPEVGSTGEDGEDLTYWIAIADELGIDHDEEWDDDEEDEEDDDE